MVKRRIQNLLSNKCILLLSGANTGSVDRLQLQQKVATDLGLMSML